ncbi:hypothetical protein [Streptomyces filamentosus]|uniref:hypothetical protein n=1 Tax=Streptomyces filamentosus TaxID=67294 RepID=UPI00123B806C|nr:hypothetical protein [Streptomyces filamentosus]
MADGTIFVLDPQFAVRADDLEFDVVADEAGRDVLDSHGVAGVLESSGDDVAAAVERVMGPEIPQGVHSRLEKGCGKEVNLRQVN